MAASPKPAVRNGAQPPVRRAARSTQASQAQTCVAQKTEIENAEGSLASFASVRAMNARMVAVAGKMYGPPEAA